MVPVTPPTKHATPEELAEEPKDPQEGLKSELRDRAWTAKMSRFIPKLVIFAKDGESQPVFQMAREAVDSHKESTGSNLSHKHPKERVFGAPSGPRLAMTLHSVWLSYIRRGSS